MVLRCMILYFIPCHRKYSKSEYRKAVVYPTVSPNLPIMHHAYNTLIMLASVFLMAWYKAIMQRFLVVYHGISHFSLFGVYVLFSWYSEKTQ